MLANVAGISYKGLMSLTTTKTFRDVFDINFFTPLRLIEMTLPFMKENGGGSIINVCSDAALFPDEGYCAYGSSKAALIEATKFYAKNLGCFNIRVNGVAPGLTETRMGLSNKTEEQLENIKDSTALHRFALPEEIANTILFLASDNASNITGEIIVCNGGRNL